MLNTMLSSINGITNFSDDLIVTILLVLFVGITVFFAAWLIANNINNKNRLLIGKVKVSGVLTIIIIAGIVIRFGLSLSLSGYMGMFPQSRYDNGNIGGLAEIFNYCHVIITRGFKLFIMPTDFPTVSYPVPLYSTLFFAKIAQIFGGLTPGATTTTMNLLMRLPMILCDAASAVVLYKLAKKYLNSQVGLIIAALYMICPVFFFASTIWGSTFSILAFPILLSLYFMTERNFLGLSISFMFALLTSRDAMFLAPVFIVFAAYYYIKSIKAHRNGEKLSFKAWFMNGERGLILRMPLYLVGTIVMMYLISLPFLASIRYNFFGFLNHIFILPFTKMSFVSFNSLSIYNLFGSNNAEFNTAIPQWLFSIVFLILGIALVVIIYSSRKNRAVMSLAAPLVVFTMSIFFMGFTELNIIIVLASLLFSFILLKDKRILQVFGVVAIAATLNASVVMMNAGYFSNFNPDNFLSGYIGSAELSSSQGGSLVSVICTGITALAFIYLTVIILDVSLSSKIKQFKNNGNAGFFGAMKNWFSIK